jgi:O-antigen/teichoic acid export membrane protein
MSALNDVRDILRGVFASFFGFGGRLIARAILMICAGRIFGIEALGYLGQVAALSEITAAICVMGLKRSLLDMLSAEEEAGRSTERRVMEALGLTLLLSFIAAAILSVIWWFVFPGNIFLITALALVVPAITVTDVILTSTKYKRIIRWDVLARCFAEPWTFLVSALCFWALGFGGEGLLYAYVCSLLAAVTLALFGFLKVFGWNALSKSSPSIKTWFPIIRKSLPVAITDIGIMALRRIDLVVLSIFVGAEGAGLYYMAQQVVTVPHKIGAMFEPMLSPVIASLHNQRKTSQIRDNLISVCRWVFTVQLAITVPLVVFAGPVMGIFGPEFTAGALVLMLILFAELIDGSFLNVETAIVYKKPRIPPSLLVIAIIIEVILIAFLSNLWGVEGAALGYLITMAALTTLRLIMLKRHLDINVLSLQYFHPIIAGSLMAAALVISTKFSPDNLPVKVALIIAGLAGFLLYTKQFALTKSDRVLWRAVSRKRKKPLKTVGDLPS